MLKKIVSMLLLCLCVSAQASSVLLYNVSRNKVEMSRDADQVRSIASITKIMTAMITLDYDIDLSRKLMLSKRVPGHLPRQMYTREQLIKAMLIKSDNAAAETLAEDYPGGRSAFVARMNLQARIWDMKHTSFVDPSGLGVFNVSTARDVADLMQTSLGYWLIREVSGQKQVAFETKYGKKIRTIHLAHTSGQLLFTFDSVLVSKTGLTTAAGWCVGMVVEQNQQQYVVVVLGSKNKQQRLDTVKDTVKDIRYNFVLDTNLRDLEITNTY
jgi:D-alanyl-D-alanine endopeptidase (penicillin-binding protein 7)